MGLVLWAFVVLFWVFSLFSFRGNENRVRGKDERSRLVLFQVPWVRARLVFSFSAEEKSLNLVEIHVARGHAGAAPGSQYFTHDESRDGTRRPRAPPH